METKPRGRKPNITPLEERVCTRGHVGQYRQRGGAIVCHECSKIAVAQFRERGGATYRPMPLKERVCRHGHVGQYVSNKHGSGARCVECLRVATRVLQERARDTTREQLNLANLLKRRDYLTRELVELALRIALEESIIKRRQE
jgi:bacterioferritin-associated ferredoxin